MRNVPIVAALCLALLLAGAARALAGRQRHAMAPAEFAGAGETGSTLGQLNSFALGLLLGGLRGPLVMALWSSSESQKSDRDLQDFDTRVELIRLLQPQFDSVHLYQIWNKAYNVSVAMANLASKYAAILDAVDYGEKVLAERPANIDLETQLGEVFNNKLGGSQESDYYRMRIHEETQADERVMKITFPATREAEFRQAALGVGVSPRRLQIRRTDSPLERVVALRESAAERVRAVFGGEDVTFQLMAGREIGARGVSGPVRMEPMLDADGALLPHLTRPRRQIPANAEPETYLDGSRAQFLVRFEPFPEGMSPHALAYNHFMKARVLQNHAGQRHVQHSEQYVDANPARALRDWAFSSFEEGRLLEAEAFGREVTPPGDSGELQAELERELADLPPDTAPASPELLRQAVMRYERSLAVGGEALASLEEHVEQYPQDYSTFGSNIGRLSQLQPLIRADLLYARLLSGDVPDRKAAALEAERLYLEANSRMLDFLMRHHTPLQMLPPGVRNTQELVGQPAWVKWDVLDRLRQARDAQPELFEHTRTLDEYDGFFDRIRGRLQQLRAIA